MGDLPSICAASAVPITPEGGIDRRKLLAHCRWLLKNGCDGVVLFGTTGEAASFGLAERQGTLEFLVASGCPAEALIVGTGYCSVTDTAFLSRHALELGCAGILVHPPYFFRPASDEGVYTFFADLVGALADAARDIVLYHFPEATGAPINASVISRLLEHFPGVFTGIKDSTGSLENMVSMARDFPDLKVFSGDDNLLSPLLEAGGYGAITATANLTPNLLTQVKSGWVDQTQAARDAQEVLVQLWEETLLKFPVSEAVKDVLANQSGDDSWRALRPPLTPLPQARREQLRAMVMPFESHFPSEIGGVT